MKSDFKHIALGLALATMIGCQASVKTVHQTAPPAAPTTQLTDAIVGKAARVSLRRDALGMSAPGFAEPMAPMIGGKPALLTGTVEQVSDRWLVLRSESRTYWIPVDAILIVETGPQ